MHLWLSSKDSCLIKYVPWREIWNLLGFDGYQKKHFCFKPNNFLKEYSYPIQSNPNKPNLFCTLNAPELYEITLKIKRMS